MGAALKSFFVERISGISFLRTVCAYSLLMSLFFMLVPGCSTKHYRQDADKEVYGILKAKWDNRFGSPIDHNIDQGYNSHINDPNENAEFFALLPGAHAITLAESVEMATENNRNYKTQKESLYLSALDLTLARDKFRPQFFASLFGELSNSDDTDSISAGGETGLDMLLADGTEIGLSVAVDWLRFLAGDPQTSLGSVITATARKPLLRGAGRKVVQENLTQSERNVLYEIRDFNRFRKDFVVDVIARYYRVLQSLDAVKNAENNYHKLSVLAESISMFAEEGRLPMFEVDQAQQNKLAARDNLVRRQQQYKQSLDEFKLFLAIPTDEPLELDANELSALTKAGIQDVDFTEADAIAIAMNQRLDLANTKARVDDAKRKINVAIDSLRMDMDLVASANASADGGSGFSGLKLDEGDYSIGLDIDFALERTAERNAYRAALIAYQRQKRTYEQQIDEVKLGVRQAFRDLQRAADSYEIQKKRLELAKIQVDSTSMLLQIGRAQTRDLLGAQDDLLDAQNNLTAAMIDHVLASLNFYLSTGILYVEPDGSWQQKITMKLTEDPEITEN